MHNEPSRRPRVGLLLFLAPAFVAGSVLAPHGHAGLIPGGGARKSDCYAELEVTGIENRSDQVRKNKIVLCADGDPCDAGPCGDNRCDVRVALCINQTDPNLPACTPPASLDGLRVSGKVSIPPPVALQGSVCGAPLELPIDVKEVKNGKLKPGKVKVKVKAKAPTGTKLRKDSDTFALQCLPRATACQSTTTTTTLPGCCTFATLSFTTGVCTGNCGQVLNSAGTNILNLARGGLYFGGGADSVPLPATVPDRGVSLIGVSSCDPNTGDLTLTARTAAETGSIRTCTEAGCLFGAPLPVPNANSIPTSTCVINTVSRNASGNGNSGTGTQNVSLPLTSEIFLTGDLLPAVSGIQPCPICTSNTCQGGPNDGNTCMPGSSAPTEAFPTSHDCPPDPSLSVGSLPIPFSLTTGTASDTSATSGGQSNVFCGYCWDLDVSNGDGGPGVCESDPSYTCLNNLHCVNAGKGGKCAGAVACQADADCGSASASRESCRQKNPGAFAKAAARTIAMTGSAAGNLCDGAPHESTLVSVFCIPPTFDATVDSAGDLPGPGAVALCGQARLLP